MVITQNVRKQNGIGFRFLIPQKPLPIFAWFFSVYCVFSFPFRYGEPNVDVLGGKKSNIDTNGIGQGVERAMHRIFNGV
jgi:hypothetical protein